METGVLLIHPLPAVSGYNLAIQLVNSFGLGFNPLAVMTPELLDLEAAIRNIKNPLVLQYAASDAVGIGVMVLGDPVVIPVGFGVPAGRDKYLAGEPRLQFLQEVRHDLVQHR